MAKIITAEDGTAGWIGDILAHHISLAGWAEEVAYAVRNRCCERRPSQGHYLRPRSGRRSWKSRGGGIWAEEGTEGLVEEAVSPRTSSSEPQMSKAIQENKMECYFWPLGVVAQWYRRWRGARRAA